MDFLNSEGTLDAEPAVLYEHTKSGVLLFVFVHPTAETNARHQIDYPGYFLHDPSVSAAMSEKTALGLHWYHRKLEMEEHGQNATQYQIE